MALAGKPQLLLVCAGYRRRARQSSVFGNWGSRRSGSRSVYRAGTELRLRAPRDRASLALLHAAQALDDPVRHVRSSAAAAVRHRRRGVGRTALRTGAQAVRYARGVRFIVASRGQPIRSQVPSRHVDTPCSPALAIASTWLLVVALERDRPRPYGAYAIASTAMVVWQFFSGLLLLGAHAYVARRSWKALIVLAPALLVAAGPRGLVMLERDREAMDEIGSSATGSPLIWAPDPDPRGGRRGRHHGTWCLRARARTCRVGRAVGWASSRLAPCVGIVPGRRFARRLALPLGFPRPLPNRLLPSIRRARRLSARRRARGAPALGRGSRCGGDDRRPDRLVRTKWRG